MAHAIPNAIILNIVIIAQQTVRFAQVVAMDIAILKQTMKLVQIVLVTVGPVPNAAMKAATELKPA